jgi:CRP/FNR family transcriptional regulator
MNELIDYLTKAEKNLVIHRQFHKNEMIFLEGSICTMIGIIIKGQVDIVSYSFSGREIIYNSLQKGDVFGNNLLFSDDPKYRGNVISKVSSVVAFIKKDSLIKIFQSNEKFLLEYLQIQSNFGKSLNFKIKLLSFDNAYERFNYYLFANDNVIFYKSVSSLAKSLYLERETVSRLLSKLESEKIIYRDKHTIKLIN